MGIHESWEKALKMTEIVRPRVQPLATFESTQIPYIFLAESLVNHGDTIIRKGEITVDKPSIILPPYMPQLEGFEFEKNFSGASDYLTTFLLMRGIRFPSMKYENKVNTLDVHEGRLRQAIDKYSKILQQQENVTTGLVIGPEDCWQFSVLIFVCTQALRSAEGDIQRIFERLKDGEK